MNRSSSGRIELLPFQQAAIDSVHEVFAYAARQLREVQRSADRRRIIAHNGCVLLQAPTGAGKTLMAGRLAERLSREQNIVWLWFAPFAGLVDQAKATLKAQCPGLRVLNIRLDRQLERLRSGDVFVTTWASVAARNKDSRKLRTDTELELSLDRLAEAVRDAGFRIGVVIDEAHHGFKPNNESARFYRQVLDPDFTLLITATPDDKDAEAFRRWMGIEVLHPVSVSREDAVGAGLIKRGVRTVAYLADPAQARLGDLAKAALHEGWRLHTGIKERLRQAGIPLTPLMLVQVNDTGKQKQSVEEARTKLRELGVPDEAVAVYTAQEPGMGLIEVAQDETKEVLIFKVAAAQGFDAPRAFTLVALRQGVRDTDFGIQTVGRILRIHRLLQGKPVDEGLQYGYVLLADAAAQSGLSQAAERINAVKNQLAEVCPYTLVARVGDETRVQVSRTGQFGLLIDDAADDADDQPFDEHESATHYPPNGAGTDQLNLFDFAPESVGRARESRPVLEGTLRQHRYPRRNDVPRRFQSERLPVGLGHILDCLGQRMRINESVLMDGLRETTPVVRIEKDLFNPADIRRSKAPIPLDEREIAKRAQRQLLEADELDPREVRRLLLRRLKQEYDRLGNPIADDPERLKRAFNKILVLHPDIIRLASSRCYAEFSESYETQPLPDELSFDTPQPPSDRNSYGIRPPGLNSHELEFVELLDHDPGDTVSWWHRNEPQKPDSVALVMPSGRRYFPDFIVRVQGRRPGDGLILIEVKGPHLLNTDDTKDKLLARHKTYRNPLMVTRESGGPDSGGSWMTVAYQERNGKVVLDRRFDVDLLATHVVSVR